ncbi:hypothetical protein PACTADRAFT_48876 [Pachysolen tannophilus NRRL Y-2460]|uniref:Uncharacterized protein n=1 Tax=Pachysolen tannophilus NRRL Y-2460 TaxID=669874 RepID=A0A1E4TZF4_PACTA|nr:hypothetical protein PACTADRAFT_48876 [Pachysolen tannophilus NRRL Y-2460]
MSDNQDDDNHNHNHKFHLSSSPSHQMLIDPLIYNTQFQECNNNNNNNNNTNSNNSNNNNNVHSEFEHTGWTPFIKQCIASYSTSYNNTNINNNNNNNVASTINSPQSQVLYNRSNSLSLQYQQVLLNNNNSLIYSSSPLKMDPNTNGGNDDNLNGNLSGNSNGISLDKVLDSNDFLNDNDQIRLSTTPSNNSRNSNKRTMMKNNNNIINDNDNFLLPDFLINTPNLSSSLNGNNLNYESPTKFFYQSILPSITKSNKKITPYHQSILTNFPQSQPETPGTKFVRSLLELPTTTPLPPSALKTRNSSPLREMISSTTPLVKKSQKKMVENSKKRKAKNDDSIENYNTRRKIKVSTTPLKNTKVNFKTPNRKNNNDINIETGEHQASSPSTIKLNTVSPSSKLKSKQIQAISPTPRNSIMGVTNNKNLRNDHNSTTIAISETTRIKSGSSQQAPPPPIGIFKKEEKILQQSSFSSSSQHQQSGFTSQSISTKDKKKFQIIFQDVNAFKKTNSGGPNNENSTNSNDNLKKKGLNRSKSTVLASNNNRKNISRSASYHGDNANKINGQELSHKAHPGKENAVFINKKQTTTNHFPPNSEILYSAKSSSSNSNRG